VLGLAQRHTRNDAELTRLVGRRDDVVVPATDDHRRAVEVRPPCQLEVFD
jgi:hypothetical protein